MRRHIWLVAAVLVVAAASPAAATFPGENGPLVFSGLDLETGTVQIYRMEATGGVPTRLTAPSGNVWNECPSWSADGQLIYFDTIDRSTADPAHIYRMNATGESRAPVDDPEAPTHLCPTVNSSGSQIAALEYADDGSEGIVVMNADGSDRKIVAGAAANQDNYGPKFAPDGPGILFYQVTFGQNTIASSDLMIVYPSGYIRNITQGDDDFFISPSWSPRGDTILAVRGADADEIVQMSSSGDKVRSLLKVPGASLGDPTFSPDGSKIAFAQCVGDCGDPSLQGTGSIWVMNADGSNLTQILDQDATGVQALTLDWGVLPGSGGGATGAIDWMPLGGPFRADPSVLTKGDVVFAVGQTGEPYYHERVDGQWSAAIALGGLLESDVAPAEALVGPQDPNFEIFGNGIDGAVWYRTRQTGWQSLGGAFLSNPTAVIFNGQTYVFGVGLDEALWYRTPHTGWASLGGIIVSDLGVTTDGTSLYVTGIGLDDAIWSRRMSGSGWHSWESLGGRVISAPVTSIAGDTGYLFAIGGDGAVWYQGVNGGTWSGWYGLGGIAESAPAVIGQDSGGLDVFVVGIDLAMYSHHWNGSDWSGWHDRGGGFVSNPAVSTTEVFGIGFDDFLYAGAIPV